ncbi:hypothetical protein MDA_GLEAN10007564 [Myotis davidii]|uniref:Uncharacterized protein n=1 Tax=Myotis davidii TaxID=225400 RepID=L5LCN5_MYODS|nr:hypothetical protein MDA_GLEAN10007564 [Myotis davidii]
MEVSELFLRSVCESFSQAGTCDSVMFSDETEGLNVAGGRSFLPFCMGGASGVWTKVTLPWDQKDVPAPSPWSPCHTLASHTGALPPGFSFAACASRGCKGPFFFPGLGDNPPSIRGCGTAPGYVPDGEGTRPLVCRTAFQPTATGQGPSAAPSVCLCTSMSQTRKCQSQFSMGRPSSPPPPLEGSVPYLSPLCNLCPPGRVVL